MAATALYPTATPGPARTFAPKASLAAQITELWATATPGPRHSFTAKEEAAAIIPTIPTGGGHRRRKPEPKPKRQRRPVEDDELILLV